MKSVYAYDTEIASKRYRCVQVYMGFPGDSDGKESTCNAGELSSKWCGSHTIKYTHTHTHTHTHTY